MKRPYYGDGLPKNRIADICEARKKLEEDLGREPFDEEVAATVGIEVDEVRWLSKFKIEPEEDETEQDFQLRIKMTIKNHELEKARSAMGLTQEQVGARLGISGALYCAIEACRIYPNDSRQKDIARLFNKPVDNLFPAWLHAFTEKWDKTKKDKVVPIGMLQLNAPEVMTLESGDMEEMERQGENGILQKLMIKSFSGLTEKEQQVLSMRYYRGLGLHEVGQSIGVSTERVRQIEAKALEKLRQLPQVKRFGPDVRT